MVLFRQLRNRRVQQLCACVLSTTFQGSNKGSVGNTDIRKPYSPEICSTNGCCQILNLLVVIMPFANPLDSVSLTRIPKGENIL